MNQRSWRERQKDTIFFQTLLLCAALLVGAMSHPDVFQDTIKWACYAFAFFLISLPNAHLSFCDCCGKTFVKVFSFCNSICNIGTFLCLLMAILSTLKEVL